jgi:hypothetical protein
MRRVNRGEFLRAALAVPVLGVHDDDLFAGGVGDVRKWPPRMNRRVARRREAVELGANTARGGVEQRNGAVLRVCDYGDPFVHRLDAPRARPRADAPDDARCLMGDVRRGAADRDLSRWAAPGADPRRRLSAAARHVRHPEGVLASGDDGTVRRYRLDGSRVSEARVPVGSYNVTFGRAWLVSPSLAAGTTSVLDRNGACARSRRSPAPPTTPASSSAPERSCS